MARSPKRPRNSKEKKVVKAVMKLRRERVGPTPRKRRTGKRS